MAKDALGVLQAEVTKTSTFNGVGYDLGLGGAGRRAPLWAVVTYRDAANASGSNTATFSVEDSDNNSAFVAQAQAAPVTLATAAKKGEIFLPIVTDKRYVRVTVTIAGAGSTPTITYKAHVSLVKP